MDYQEYYHQTQTERDVVDLSQINTPLFQELDPIHNQNTKQLFSCIMDIDFQKINQNEFEIDTLTRTFSIRVLVDQESTQFALIKIYLQIIFTCNLTRADEISFEQIKENNHLNCLFSDYMDVVTSLLKNAIQGSQSITIKGIMNEDEQIILEFYREDQIKNFLLLSINFIRIPEMINKKLISYKFIIKDAQVQILEQRFLEIMRIVNWKNPALGHIIKNYLTNQ